MYSWGVKHFEAFAMVAAENHPPRKLAAILLADVVGYSRLMGEDEAGTLARLKTHQQEFIDPTISMFHGRIVKLMGDGVLVEFPSVVEAVSCAVAIQKGMAERNEGADGSKLIQFRIGVNLCDVIIDGDDIFGDGVNITARLEGLATPGCICISGAVYDALGNKLPLEYESLGEKKVKNIAHPVRAYSVQLAPGAELPLPGSELKKLESELPSSSSELPMSTLVVKKERSWKWLPVVVLGVAAIVAATLFWLQLWQQDEEARPVEHITTTLPDKPSIAVLPFDNMSNDPKQEYFSDGISEDIITNLSRVKNLAVIARNSSFTYKGTGTKVQDIGKDLAVKYVLEGSVRKSTDRVRITAQLIDADTGHHLWAERFDRELTDVFAVQDEITDLIVSALSIQLSGDEQKNLAHSETNNFEAYDLFLQGQREFFQASETSQERAAELYRQAINLDPGFARPYGALAVTLTRQSFLGYSDTPVESKVRALELARKAVSIDPTSPHALWALGYVYMHTKRFDEAIETLQRAVTIAPNYADGYGLLALINNNIGQSEEAIQLLKKGMKLNPYYTWDYLYNLGRAYHALGDYEKAAQYLEKGIERNEAVPHMRLYLVSCYVQLSRMDDAEWQVTELGMQFSDASLSHWRKALSIVDEAVRSRLFYDLRTAGMAE
jgi:TolB-like protein/class 3 adenylate cyclase/cytochrome c-type biogenesis protein CcmH/NrfG